MSAIHALSQLSYSPASGANFVGLRVTDTAPLRWHVPCVRAGGESSPRTRSSQRSAAKRSRAFLAAAALGNSVSGRLVAGVSPRRGPCLPRDPRHAPSAGRRDHTVRPRAPHRAFGGVLTISLAPLVARLDRWIPRRAAVVIVFFGTLLSIVGLVAVLVWQLATEGQRLGGQLSALVDALEGKNTIVIGFYGLPQNVQESLRQLFGPIAATMAERSAGVAIALASSLVDLVLVLVVTFYFLLDERRLRVALIRTIEPGRRPPVRRVFQEVSRVFGAYVRAQLVLALSIGVLVGGALLALGVPYAIFLAIFAAIAELIPMVGPSPARSPRCSSPRRCLPSGSLGRGRLPCDPAARIERAHAAALRERGRTSPCGFDPRARARVRALGRHRCALRGPHRGPVVGAAVDRGARVARQTNPAAAMGATNAPRPRSRAS